MSDKLFQHYLHNIDDMSTAHQHHQQQISNRKTNKIRTNDELRQKLPPFIVPTAIYKVIMVNKYTSMEEMHLLIHHVQECTQFTIDTESERSNYQLALIQIQTIPPQLPFLAILIELQHLPSNSQPTYVKLKEFFTLVFRSGNKLYSWGDMKKELNPTQDYNLFNWSTLASLTDIQQYFSRWYEWALAHCESCRQNHHQHYNDDVMYDNITTRNYSTSYCNCHERSPYRPNEKWSLQKALAYTVHMFIDKSSTVNNWAAGLTSATSTLSFGRRKKMIHYAIYDCFSTTYLVRPVLEYWTFQQLKNINITQLFTSFESLTLPPNHSSQTKIKKNINLHQLFKINNDDLQSISDDDEIYVNQLIAPVKNEQPATENNLNVEQGLNEMLLPDDVELISEDDNEIIVDHNQAGPLAEDNNNNEDQPDIVIEMKPRIKRNRPHRERSKQSRKKRNRKRNNTHRMRRYQYYVTRPMYHKFTMPLVKKILQQHNVNYIHVKKNNEFLIIGVKDNSIQHMYHKQLPEDIFSRANYRIHQHHHK